MHKKQYFHLCAKGADARNFIICREDYYAVFNLIGVCAANTSVVVVSFSIEDSHPHILVWGTAEECMAFMHMFENLFKHYAAATRPRGSGLVLNCEAYPIGYDESYLLNVAIYTIIQPTKDGKPVMFYDYRWGTGSMYFRNKFHTPVWQYDDNGNIREPVRFGTLDSVSKRNLLHSRTYTIPDCWLVCNGFILPSNYVDVSRFESIYRSHNRFRVFASSPKKREDEMNARMADYRGVSFDDMEARRLCGDSCKQMFGIRDPRRLDGPRRIELAQYLRRQYRLSFRQLSTLVRLSEVDLRAYIH